MPGEERFVGRGISYCATCDGDFFADRPIADRPGSGAVVDHVADELRVAATRVERSGALGQVTQLVAKGHQLGDTGVKLGGTPADQLDHVVKGVPPRLRKARISRISPRCSPTDSAARTKR